MTRKEQKIAALRDREIKIAASNYVEENSVNGYEAISSHRDSFIEGADWADEHLNLESLWHDVIEAPKLLNQWFLAQIGDNAFDTFVMEMDKNKDWREWSNGINIKRWIYITDLLPKQFGNSELLKGGEE